MKRYIAILLSVICFFAFAACSVNVSDVKVTSCQSERYTDEEIQSAIEVTKNYFKEHFSGCTLTEITYAGDEYSQSYSEWAERIGAEEVIVLMSSFEVAASGADGSLNPNSTYDGWMWILARKEGGKWEHVDHGY